MIQGQGKVIQEITLGYQYVRYYTVVERLMTRAIAIVVRYVNHASVLRYVNHASVVRYVNHASMVRYVNHASVVPVRYLELAARYIRTRGAGHEVWSAIRWAL